MTQYLAITDPEVESGKPAKGIAAQKLRDNPIAITEGAAGAPRIEPTALRPVLAGTVVIAHQGDQVPAVLSSNSDRVLLRPSSMFFRASIVVPGVYTFAGTANIISVTIRVDGSTVHSGTGAISHEMTLTQGQIISANIVGGMDAGLNESLTDFRLMADYVPPMGQCQFVFNYRHYVKEAD
jgi:hypothetical protein